MKDYSDKELTDGMSARLLVQYHREFTTLKTRLERIDSELFELIAENDWDEDDYASLRKMRALLDEVDTSVFARMADLEAALRRRAGDEDKLDDIPF